MRTDAVVGVKGTVETIHGKVTLTKVGLSCALCHSTVDESTPWHGVGKRQDGWANSELNVGAIVALSPAVPETAKAVYRSWGPGKYDPRFNLDHPNGPRVGCLAQRGKGSSLTKTGKA